MIPKIWTDERIADLERLWGDGLSCSQIAMQLQNGISRNAVIGKIGRLGISARGLRDPAINRRKPPRPRAVKSTVAVPPSDHALKAQSIAKPGEPAPLSILLLASTASQCRWIANEPTADATICGHETEPGRSYCAFHCGRAYDKVSTERARKKYQPPDVRRAA